MIDFSQKTAYLYQIRNYTYNMLKSIVKEKVHHFSAMYFQNQSLLNMYYFTEKRYSDFV